MAFRIKPFEQSTFKAQKRSDPTHLDWIRDLPCWSCGWKGGRIRNEAAHIRFSHAPYGKLNPGLGKRSADCWVLPLCAKCHREGKAAQHAGSETEFWHEKGINPLLDALLLYACCGDTAHAQVIFLTRYERGPL